MRQSNFFEELSSQSPRRLSPPAPQTSSAGPCPPARTRTPEDAAPSGFRLSDEQLAIVIAPLRQRTKIKAFAGTGKTTTLEHKARHHAIAEGRKGLYLAFNKSAQLEAQSRFGSAAVCKTTHGVAFAVHGRKYAHKLRQMRPKDLVDMGATPDYAEARLILDAINDFCIGAAVEFPKQIKLGRLKDVLSPARATQLRDIAIKIWQSMCDPQSSVPMSHDGYLKLFQLGKPRLPGDYLMVDEFQDTNPVVLDIVQNQPQPVIVVGDPYQSIYAFRGAVNAMKDFSSQFNFALTHSRRFGPEVATIANELLSACFAEKARIVGAGGPTRITRVEEVPSGEPLSIITRTNAELFEHAVRALQSNRRMAFIGGVKGYNFRDLIDVQLVAQGRHSEVHDPFIRSFASFWQMSQYADDVQDYGLQRMVKTCEAYGNSIFTLVEQVHASATDRIDEAERILTTAHKSKGSTLDNVLLGDDFKPIVEMGENGALVPVEDLDPQEINLSYVAVTRARKSLSLCPALIEFRAFFRRNRGVL